MRLKELTSAEWARLSYREQRLTPGHRLCSGCGHPIIVKQIFLGLPRAVPVVVCTATGCLEVSTSIYPHNAWNVPFIHQAFENVAATAAGIEAAWRALKKKGRINKEIKIVTLPGDGGTHDIGLQALSGALERGHDVVHTCLDNGAYMNTGIQRSSATPWGASTTTSPAGRVIPGKGERRKDICRIVLAHRIPYVAQASPSHPADLIRKAKKAFEIKGPCFLNVLSPCPPGWGMPENESLAVANEAVTSCYWPLYEVENGKYRLTYKPREKTPVVEWLRKQGRFRHLFEPQNEHLLVEIQKQVDQEWEELLELCGEK